GADRDQGPGRRLRVQGGEGIDAVAVEDRPEVDRRAGPTPERGLRERDGQAAVGQVVGTGEQTAAHGLDEEVREGLLRTEVDLRRATAEVAVERLRPLAAVELLPRLAEEDDRLSGRPEGGGDG